MLQMISWDININHHVAVKIRTSQTRDFLRATELGIFVCYCRTLIYALGNQALWLRGGRRQRGNRLVVVNEENKQVKRQAT